MNHIPLAVGLKINHFTIAAPLFYKHDRIYYRCNCICGKEKEVKYSHLKSGLTKSCGCQHGWINKQTHRKSKTLMYHCWNSMMQRCLNKNNLEYKNYGGRGISVCPEWLLFETFVLDMGEKPEGLEIDRINNNGNYSKENCRWVTRSENQRNRRRNRLYFYDGKMKCMYDLAKEYNIHPSTLRSRLEKGMSINDSITKKVLPVGAGLRKLRMPK